MVQDIDHPQKAVLLSTGYVKDPADSLISLTGQQVRPDHVGDIGKIARLETIPVDRRTITR